MLMMLVTDLDSVVAHSEAPSTTRIAWKDVRQVRPGSRGFGPGWVELVTERVVRLPVAVTTYPVLRHLWAQAAGASPISDG